MMQRRGKSKFIILIIIIENKDYVVKYEIINLISKHLLTTIQNQ